MVRLCYALGFRSRTYVTRFRFLPPAGSNVATQEIKEEGSSMRRVKQKEDSRWRKPHPRLPTWAVGKLPLWTMLTFDQKTLTPP